MAEANDEAWLSELSAESDSGDPATRQARLLRAYYAARGQRELDESLDEASYTRAMNYLRARGAFAQTPEARPTAMASLLRWLFPAKGGARGHYALLGGLLVALVALPLVLNHINTEEAGAPPPPPPRPLPAPVERPLASEAAPALEMPAAPKQLAKPAPALKEKADAPPPPPPPLPATSPSATSPPPFVPPPTVPAPAPTIAPNVTGGASQSDKRAASAAELNYLPRAVEPRPLYASDPAQLAQTLAALLQSHGITARLSNDQNESSLEAELGNAPPAELRQALQQQGVDVPAHGRLRLRIRKR